MTPSEQEAAYLRGELSVCSACRTLQLCNARNRCIACSKQPKSAPFIKPSHPPDRRGVRDRAWYLALIEAEKKPPVKTRPPDPHHRPVRRRLQKGSLAYEKMVARSYANAYKRRGVLKPQPCRCGSTDVEMHHLDYTKPLLIEWWCRPCHMEQHGVVSREIKGLTAPLP